MKSFLEKLCGNAGIVWKVITLLFLAGFYFAIITMTQKSVEAVCDKQTKTDDRIAGIDTRVTVIETKIIGMKETVDGTSKDVKELLKRR